MKTEQQPSALGVSIPVWGQEYMHLLTQCSLLTHLSPNNIPAIAQKLPCYYLIYTTEADAEILRASPVYKSLARFAEIRIYYISSLVNTNLAANLPLYLKHPKAAERYEISSCCYKKGLEEALKLNAALIMMNADAIFSDGFFNTVWRVLELKKRALGSIGLRAIRSNIYTSLRSNYLSEDGCSINITPQDLAKETLKNLHPIMRRHFWDQRPADFHPSHLYWNVNETNMILRAYHLHPIMLYPRAKHISFSSTIDDDCLHAAGLTVKEMHVEEDNNNCFYCELSALDHYVGDPQPAFSKTCKGLAFFYSKQSTPKNIYNLDFTVHVHSKPCDQDTLNKIRRRSDRVVFKVRFFFVLIRILARVKFLCERILKYLISNSRY